MPAECQAELLEHGLVNAVGVAALAGRRHQEVALRDLPLLGEGARHQGHQGGHAAVRQGAHRRRVRRNTAGI